MSRITVLKVNKTKADKGYIIVELAYKTEDGKTKGMKIFPFGDQKEIHAVASDLQQGDVLEASFKKNEKGFWDFAALQKTGEKTAQTSTSSGQGVSRGGWETAEERAEKQGKISKQAVLNTAVAYFEVNKGKPTPEQVVEVAQYFLDYVNGKQQQVTNQPTGDVE